ncbi:DsbA family protein [Candidatus Aenigmatarchaeota archaeon]
MKKIILGVVVLIVIIAAAYLLVISPDQTGQVTGTGNTPVNTDKIPIDEIKNYKGSDDAPVIIEEYSEFACPYCARFAKETLPQIQSQYIDTGKVKLIFKDYIVHDSAKKPAEATWCAGEQGKFFEMHDKLFANFGASSDADLKKYADEIGLNREVFDECLSSGVMTLKVNENMEEGRSKGVSGTPIFFINGEELRGAKPFVQFQAAIEKALAETE